MDRLAAALFLILACAVPASASDTPARKAGLWEIKTNRGDGRAMSIQQCVDAKTDQAMQSNIGAAPQRDCSKRDVQRSADTITIDSVCTIGGKTVTHHTVMTGRFDSDYTMTMTTGGEGASAGRTTTIAAKWVGPCAADQKPGDMIMPNGQKMNIVDMKGAARPNVPMPVPAPPPSH